MGCTHPYVSYSRGSGTHGWSCDMPGCAVSQSASYQSQSLVYPQGAYVRTDDEYTYKVVDDGTLESLPKERIVQRSALDLEAMMQDKVS